MRLLHWLRIAIIGVFLTSLLPVAATAQTATSTTSYTSEEFGYTVEWTEDWSFDPDAALKFPGMLELITLFRGPHPLFITAYAADRFTIEEALEIDDDDELIDSDLTDEVPFTYVSNTLGYEYNELYVVNDGKTILAVEAWGTTEDEVDQMIGYAQEELTINGSPILTAEPIEPISSIGITTAEPTATATATSTTTRTRRSTTTETPTPTASGLTTYTGSVYGYTLEYDPEIWEVLTEFNEETTDGLQLESDYGRLTIFSYDGHGTDPATCLDGEVEYYQTRDKAISSFEPALDADGKEMRFDSDDLSWGVFRAKLADNTSGSELVQYLSCQPIPGEDAMLVVVFAAIPENYNDGLDAALDVLDTIQYGSGHQADLNPTATAVENTSETTTQLDGSLYTSEQYGFTIDIPLQWDILDTTTEGTNEKILLTNGTSDVLVWATGDYTGNVSGCVDWAAAQSGLDLTLDTNASGREFRGVYQNEAFANFVYTDGGTEMLYFVSCRSLGADNENLILIQDVEYSKFSTERRYRTDIENGITLP